MSHGLSFVFLGLSITSSWGNGHATTYRGLLRELAARGHGVTFLERDLPFYAANRDLASPPYGKTALYGSLEELKDSYTDTIRQADWVIVGSYVPSGVAVCEWVLQNAKKTGFYDIDTPVTLAKMAKGDYEYICPSLVPKFDLYLSFTGGPTLNLLERQWGARCARPLYCAVDPAIYYPEPKEMLWELGYLGTYSADRQPALDVLLLACARSWPEGRFMVAGPQYPDSIGWPPNVQRAEHLAPSDHRAFYNSQRFTLSVTRQQMVQLGYSPSVRLFEAAACSTPIITDWWPGIETFFEPGTEILIAHSTNQTLNFLTQMDETQRQAVAERARQRVLREHTAAHRAETLESYTRALLEPCSIRREAAFL